MKTIKPIFYSSAMLFSLTPAAIAPSAKIAGPQYLMTSPEQWSKGQDAVFRRNTFARWQAVRNAVQQAGGQVIVIDGRNPAGGPREVWARDKYVLIGNAAYLPDEEQARFRPDGDGYVNEIRQAERFLQANGVRTYRVKDAWFEGGNIIQHAASKTLFIGVSAEGYDPSARLLTEEIHRHSPDVTVVPVPLVNFSNPNSPWPGHFYQYHLDTGMSEPLPSGEILLSPTITDKKTLQIIQDRIGAKNIIWLGQEDSDNYTANIMVIHRTIISSVMSGKLRAGLEGRGYIVREGKDFGLDQLGFGFGGPHCDVNIIPPSLHPAHSL